MLGCPLTNGLVAREETRGHEDVPNDRPRAHHRGRPDGDVTQGERTSRRDAPSSATRRALSVRSRGYCCVVCCARPGRVRAAHASQVAGATTPLPRTPVEPEPGSLRRGAPSTSERVCSSNLTGPVQPAEASMRFRHRQSALERRDRRPGGCQFSRPEHTGTLRTPPGSHSGFPGGLQGILNAPRLDGDEQEHTTRRMETR